MSLCDLTQLTQCEHCVLNILGSHLIQKEGNELECSQIRRILAQFRTALEYEAIISLSRDGKIQFITQRAQEILKQYFPSSTSSKSLPLNFKKWLEYETCRFTLSGDAFCRCSSLLIEKDEKELDVYFIWNQVQEEHILLLEEKKKSIFSINDLELLGLTKRESEVLFWVSKDKSNIKIAKIIGCSEGTVRKHLEHIRVKLNAHTRTGSVMVALERLGILRQ